MGRSRRRKKKQGTNVSRRRRCGTTWLLWVAVCGSIGGLLWLASAMAPAAVEMAEVQGHAGLGHHHESDRIRDAILQSTRQWGQHDHSVGRSKADARIDCPERVRARFGTTGESNWIDLIAELMSDNPQLSRFYSQDGEDVYLLRRFFAQEPFQDGVFVDVGAMDGMLHSNTMTLEEAYGWRGVCIEPAPRNFVALLRNRPQCRNSNAAVCGAVGRATIFGDGLGASQEPNTHLRGERFRKGTAVTCMPLSMFADMNGITHIELLAVDVGGQELEVIKSHNFTRIPVLVTIVEMKDGQEVVNRMTREHLHHQGMCRVAWDVGHGSEVFVPRLRFARANPFDDWPPPGTPHSTF